MNAGGQVYFGDESEISDEDKQRLIMEEETRKVHEHEERFRRLSAAIEAEYLQEEAKKSDE